MKTALVIGGTGMLAGLSKQLTEYFDIVGVVGRSPARFTDLLNFSRNIAGHAVDYSDATAFTKELGRFTGLHGRPQLVVSWIHSTSPDAPLILADYCADDFYDVTGHEGIKSDHISRRREHTIKAKGIRYHRVILGQKDGRWLTNQEISQGVYEAIKTGKPEYLVGRL